MICSSGMLQLQQLSSPNSSCHPPIDSTSLTPGIAQHVTREEIIAEARKSEDFFVMDFAGLESSWIGTIHIAPMNRDAIKGALSTFQLFRLYPYRANYKEFLDAADTVLADLPRKELTATVQCDTSEDVFIETATVSV